MRQFYMFRFKKQTTLLFAALLSLRCAPDAPHDNPMDPASRGFRNTGGITGRVLTLNEPRQPVAAALISTAQGTASVTGDDGSFQVVSLPAGDDTIVVSKAGFLSDTVMIVVSASQSALVEIHLDALPNVSQASVVTQKIDQWWPGPIYSAYVTSSISDPDGLSDIDTTFVSVDTLSFPLVYSVTDKNFQTTISTLQLPTNNIQWLVGKPLTFVAKDRSGGVFSRGGVFVSRAKEECHQDPGGRPLLPLP